jgi:uncharacterized coiled-coil protein SlyX
MQVQILPGAPCPALGRRVLIFPGGAMDRENGTLEDRIIELEYKLGVRDRDIKRLREKIEELEHQLRRQQRRADELAYHAAGSW